MQTLGLVELMPTYAEIRAEKATAGTATPAPVAATVVKRSYQHARLNRLTLDWTISPTSGYYELRRSLRALRARARDLARNDDYVAKFLKLVEMNVCGPTGIKLQVTGGMNDAVAGRVEAAWEEWGHAATASASGRLSWRDIQRLWARTLARDGEVLVRKLMTPTGLALKFINCDYLDETHNAELPNGHRILMGVEIDALDRPVAYWLTPPATGETWQRPAELRQRVRVPASEIIHSYLIIEDESQTRGVPWTHTALFRLKQLQAYEEAEVVAARVGASKGGFYKRSSDAGAELMAAESTAPLPEALEPGTFFELPPDYDFVPFDPTHPTTGYADFVKAVTRGIASGLGVAYASLSGDLREVNYSSIRAGLLEERDIWRTLQDFMVESFCRPVYLAWLEASVMSDALNWLTPRDYDGLQSPRWQARGWAWVDPLKDIQATVLAVQNGLTTRTQACADDGEDFADVIKQLAAEKALMEAAGLSPAAPLTSVVSPPEDGASNSN